MPKDTASAKVVRKKGPKRKLPKIYDKLTRIAKELSKKPNSAVEQICDTLLADLDLLCAAVRVNDKAITSLPRVSTHPRPNKEPFGGTYVGFGLGEGWLNLGFLEGAVAGALEARFGKMSADYHADKPRAFKTMGAEGIAVGGVYVTKKNGTYEIELAHTFFVRKRVEPT